jgi:thiol:disulfide interchange protein DsbD
MSMRALIFGLVTTLFAQAQIPGIPGVPGLTGEPKNPDASTYSLLSEVKSIAPGQKFSVALALTHQEGWHSYYKNPGGIEDSPTISWKVPAGFQAGDMQWPTPHVADPAFQFDDANPEKAYTYSNSDGFFITEITAPADLKVGSTVTITADAKWQICKDSCVNEKALLSIELPVAATAEIDPANQEAFTKGRAAQPKASDLTFEIHKSTGSLQLRISGAQAMTDAHFISDHKMIMPSATMAARAEGDVFVIDLKTRKELFSGETIESSENLSGILTFSDASGKRSVLVPSTAIVKAPAPPLPFAKFLPVLLGMFFGGLILNLMPCVFPVIGIKILGFVQQAGQDKKKIILHGVLFTLGVLVSFWILSGILFAARQAAGGEEFGWGYQLQNKWVVLGLMMLMFIMALNLFGVFEIGTSATSVGGNLQNKQGLSGSFFSGFLATVVATPCSGPFLGAAIGAAIVLPPVQFFTAFTVMALGLSVPYLLMSIFPKLVDYLPRPGAWMETFKQGMSFLLFATAGYLLWIYAGIIDLDHALKPILGLSIVALACWIYGRWTGFAKPKRTRVIASVFALALLVFGIFFSGHIKQGVTWETWSEERVEELLEEDTPVFVDFTAKWCALCQVNKGNAYSDEVVQLMKERGIVALKADKTKADPKIEEALAKLDRTAIPVNVLYVPGKDLIITPEVLTSDYLLKLFRENTEELKEEM